MRTGGEVVNDAHGASYTLARSRASLGASRACDQCVPDREEPAADDDLGLVVAQLRGLARTQGLVFALEVGQLLSSHFCVEGAATWEQQLKRNEAFQELWQRPDLPISQSMARRCVGVYELCLRLNAAARWRHLTVTHLRAVLGLPEEDQARLLDSASAHKWSSRQLDTEVARLRAGGSASRGRPPMSRKTKALWGLTTASNLPPLPDDLTGLTSAQRVKLLSAVATVHGFLERAKQWMARSE